MLKVIGSVVILNDVCYESSIPTGFAVYTGTTLVSLGKWICPAMGLSFLEKLLKLKLLGY